MVTSNNQPPWWNRFLGRLKNQKSRIFKLWKNSGSHQDYENYIVASNNLTDAEVNAYVDYVNNMGIKLKTNPRLFHKYISYKREAKGYPCKMSFDDQMSDDPEEICNMFASYYESVYEPPFDFDRQNFDHVDNDVVSVSDLEVEFETLTAYCKIMIFLSFRKNRG